MTKKEMLTMFEALIDDTLDSVLEEQLLNEAKDSLEAEYSWAILKQVDATQSAAVGDTYLSMHTLPTRFAAPSQKGIYVGNDQIPYSQIPFEDRLRFRDITHRYYIDLANNQYALTGVANPGGMIQFFYQQYSGSLDADGDTWLFPTRFHPILPYRMAIKFFAIDQGDKSRAYDDRWDVFATKVLEAMVQWNARMTLQASQNSRLSVDMTARPDIVDIDGSGSGGVFYG